MNAEDLDEMYQKTIEQVEELNEKIKEHAKQNPTQYIPTLFIGGSADGQWRNIPEHAVYVDVPIIYPAPVQYKPKGTHPDVTIEDDRYSRVILQDTTQRYSVMVLNLDNVIQQLIQGYRKQGIHPLDSIESMKH